MEAPAEVLGEVLPARDPGIAGAMAATVVEVTVGVEGLQGPGQVTTRRVAATLVLEDVAAIRALEVVATDVGVFLPTRDRGAAVKVSKTMVDGGTGSITSKTSAPGSCGKVPVTVP
jgi:hypothetical protein